MVGGGNFVTVTCWSCVCQETDEAKLLWNNLHKMREKYREQQGRHLKDLERISVNASDIGMEVGGCGFV